MPASYTSCPTEPVLYTCMSIFTRRGKRLYVYMLDFFNINFVFNKQAALRKCFKDCNNDSTTRVGW